MTAPLSCSPPCACSQCSRPASSPAGRCARTSPAAAARIAATMAAAGLGPELAGLAGLPADTAGGRGGRGGSLCPGAAALVRTTLIVTAAVALLAAVVVSVQLVASQRAPQRAQVNAPASPPRPRSAALQPGISTTPSNMKAIISGQNDPSAAQKETLTVLEMYNQPRENGASPTEVASEEADLGWDEGPPAEEQRLSQDKEALLEDEDAMTNEIMEQSGEASEPPPPSPPPFRTQPSRRPRFDHHHHNHHSNHNNNHHFHQRHSDFVKRIPPWKPFEGCALQFRPSAPPQRVAAPQVLVRYPVAWGMPWSPWQQQQQPPAAWPAAVPAWSHVVRAPAVYAASPCVTGQCRLCPPPVISYPVPRTDPAALGRGSGWNY